MSPMPLQAIGERRSVITRELQRLKQEYEKQVAELEREHQELEIAARVFQRLGIVNEPPLPFPEAKERGKDKLTIPEMIMAVIRLNVAVGLPGATSKEVVSAIEKRWGEHDPNHIRPTLWRMVQDGRLEKSDDGFYTISDNDGD